MLAVVDIPAAGPAIALYRIGSWQEIVRVGFNLTDMHLDEIVFVGPTA